MKKKILLFSRKHSVPPIDERFIITVKTDNAGTSNDNQFTIPTSTFGITQAFNYDIETSDGQTITGNTGNTTITFPSAGTYDIFISGSFPKCYFNNGGDKAKLLDIKNFGIYALGSTSQERAFHGCSNMDISATDIGHFENVNNFFVAWSGCSNLTSFPLIDTSSATSFNNTWYNCSSLTSFPLIDTSNVTDFSRAWGDCRSLTSFPLIDTSSGTNFGSGFNTGAWHRCLSLTSFPLIDTSNAITISNAWNSCSNLTSFPLIDTSSVTNFSQCWAFCGSLTSFPLIDTSSGTNFQQTWLSNGSLTSFPLIDTSSGTIFDRAWSVCSSLTSFPANAFDSNIATNYLSAFTSTNLTTQSIDDILVSLDTSGVSNGTFAQSGGQGRSYNSNAAVSSLIAKGWTLTLTTPVASPEFVIQVKTDNAGTSADNQFTLPWIGTYDVDWGDGNVDTGVTNAQTHTYATAGTYDVAVTAETGRIFFSVFNSNGGDRDKLLEIKNWGTCAWTSMERAFRSCTNLINVDSNSIPNFSNPISTTRYMFFLCNSLTSLNVQGWDVSGLSDFEGMFSGMSSLEEIVGLDEFAFTVSNNINGFKSMFQNSPNCNFNVSNWILPLGTICQSMFDNCDSFDRDLSGWNIRNVANLSNFMSNANGFSTSNYDATLIGWEATLQTTYPNGAGYPHTIGVNFGGSQYSLGGAAEAARTSLINTYGWTITDGGGIFVGLLDEYPNAAAAYSLRELSTAFVGQPVVRVRRSSDNTEQDFTATEITDGTLTTFTGANDGFVTTWYDQSGNGVDGVQATANIQPKIVDNGVLESDNGKPTINFFAVAGSRLATSSDNIISQPTTYFTVGRLNNTPSSVFFDSRLIDTNRQIYGNLFGGTKGIGLLAGTQLQIMPYTPKTIISTTIFNSTNSKGYINGIERGVGDAGTQSINWGTIGSYVNATSGNISTQEIILYPTNQDANRLPIETNINNHYIAYGDVINGGFLNTYQGFNAAYSLRKLAEYDNGYDVEVVNVRRSSDNINRDFTSTEITDGTLESFVGVGNDGFVTAWYDQSLNQNHLFRGTVNNNQPKIVENGVLLLNDGKPALKFDITDNLAPNNPINSKNVYIVEKTLDFSPAVVGLLGDSTQIWTGGSFGTVTGIGIYDGTTIINSNVEDLDTHLIVGEYDVNGALYVDGNLEGTASLNSGTISIVGRRDNFNFNGYIQELLISDIDVSVNRTAIETNINNEYNIW